MIALLIGGTVVLCTGLLAVVYGVPIKEFSFGNTMILAGSIVACTGLVLIGLSAVGRELRNLTRRLEAGIAIPTVTPVDVPVSAPQDLPPVRPPLRSPPSREDTLFTRDQPFESDRDRFSNDTRSDPPAEEVSPLSASWQEPAVARSRNPLPPVETVVPPPAQPSERPRRNIMFSSHRRDANKQDQRPRDELPPEVVVTEQEPVADVRQHDAAPEPDNAFDHAWPQSGRSRSETPLSPSGRVALQPADLDPPEPPRERFQPPRRADESAVTIVKSGVVDSMAYSLYSDGSIEAQMPEGTVRFASIDELRSHLDQRG